MKVHIVSAKKEVEPVYIPGYGSRGDQTINGGTSYTVELRPLCENEQDYRAWEANLGKTLDVFESGPRRTPEVQEAINEVLDLANFLEDGTALVNGAQTARALRKVCAAVPE